MTSLVYSGSRRIVVQMFYRTKVESLIIITYLSQKYMGTDFHFVGGPVKLSGFEI